MLLFIPITSTTAAVIPRRILIIVTEMVVYLWRIHTTVSCFQRTQIHKIVISASPSRWSLCPDFPKMWRGWWLFCEYTNDMPLPWSFCMLIEIRKLSTESVIVIRKKHGAVTASVTPLGTSIQLYHCCVIFPSSVHNSRVSENQRCKPIDKINGRLFVIHTTTVNSSGRHPPEVRDLTGMLLRKYIKSKWSARTYEGKCEKKISHIFAVSHGGGYHLKSTATAPAALSMHPDSQVHPRNVRLFDHHS